MSEPFLATVDAQSQLIVSHKRHQVAWLEGRDTTKCVVEVVASGVVRIWALETWAANEDLTVREAEDGLQTTSIGPLGAGTKTSGMFLEVANRKQQTGRPVHELRLPDMAVFALFGQGQGPMAVRKGGGGSSGKVLLVVFQGYFELWGQCVL